MLLVCFLFLHFWNVYRGNSSVCFHYLVLMLLYLIYDCFTCMCDSASCMWLMPQRHRCFGTGVADGCSSESPCGCWKFNQVPIESYLPHCKIAFIIRENADRTLLKVQCLQILCLDIVETVTENWDSHNGEGMRRHFRRALALHSPSLALTPAPKRGNSSRGKHIFFFFFFLKKHSYKMTWILIFLGTEESNW